MDNGFLTAQKLIEKYWLMTRYLTLFILLLLSRPGCQTAIPSRKYITELKARYGLPANNETFGIIKSFYYT